MNPEALTLNGFLNKYKRKDGEKMTHTRIPSVELGVFGGSFTIPDDKLDAFYKIYHKEVIKGGGESYLTEVQLEELGNILIDLDERYNGEVTERQHEDEHIDDIIGTYIDNLVSMINIDKPLVIPCFIMEKDNINIVSEDLVKDGIHIIFGARISYDAQLFLRSKVLSEIDNVFSDLPLTNSYEQLVDNGIPTGKTNWQLFGSKKPGHEPYKLKKKMLIKIRDANDISFKDEKVDFTSIEILKQVSARNSNNIILELNEETKEEIKKTRPIKLKRKKVKILPNRLDTLLQCEKVFPSINSIEKCDFVIKKIIDLHANENDDKVIQASKLLELLDEKYYGEGSYDKWIKVAWACKTISQQFLYPSWLKMSSKSQSFSWDDNDCFKIWNGNWDPEKSPTMASLKYWAKECDPDKYDIIKRESNDYYIYKSLESEAEYDVAKLVKNVYEDRFKCTNIKSKIWYEYSDGRWEIIDSGTTLRQALSQGISSIYHCKVKETLDSLSNSTDSEEDKEENSKLRKDVHIMCQMAMKLKKTTWKGNVMRECCEVFFDRNFLNKLDRNPYLLCFKNGVLDMKEQRFRDGRPEDYLSLCTDTNYIPFDETDEEQVQIRKEIDEFMSQLFPIPNVKKYMYEHLASSLLGTNQNQTFNLYFGSGANGKSKLVTLMGMVLGKYKGSVPLTIITQKRSSIGSVSPEVAQLRGLRYAVMQEPSQNTKLNEGPFKELVGDDPIQGRALFQDTVTFVPQFTLAVCTNVLFDITSNDHGTWRRIRIVDFISKFVEEPSEDPLDYEFKIDRDIDTKFKKWAPIFTTMLVEKLFETNGVVTDCPEVMASSQKYKEQQDFFAGFMKERIVKCEGSLIKKTDAYSEFQEWYSELYGGRVPSGKDLFECMEKQYGKPSKLGWTKLKLLHSYDLVDDDDIQANEIE